MGWFGTPGRVVTVVAVGGLITGVTVGSLASAPQSSQAEDVIVAQGVDRRPSDSAADWVTYADHVVAVTATDQSVIPPTPEEVRRGEGLIGRDVTLKVDEVVWSRQDAPKPAPDVWERTSMGWQFRNGSTSDRTPIVLAERPRIEVGHRYILAIGWVPACGSGRGEWRGLGEGATVPYDDGVIGVGETEGDVISLQDAERAARRDSPNRSLEDRLVGQNGSALTAALDAAKPTGQGTAESRQRQTCGRAIPR